MRSTTRKAPRIISRSSRATVFLFAGLVCLASVGLAACEQSPVGAETARKPHPRIESPATGAEYSLGQLTLLRASDGVEWTSSLDGYLGSGKSLAVRLCAGSHEIAISAGNGACDCVSVTVSPPEVSNRYQLDIQGTGASLVVPPGEYAPYLVSYSADRCSVSVSPSKYGEASVQPVLVSCPSPFLRDLNLWTHRAGTRFLVERKRTGRSLLPADIGDQRVFRFVNLETGTGAGVPVYARLAWSSNRAEIWLDQTATVADGTVAEMGRYLEDRLIPHHESTWGEWMDIDGNGKLAVLCTPRFNESGVAVGLFNPADFYAYCEDPSSDAYNPCANEMDMLYVGCPDDNGNDANFTTSSIFATMAHELQHLTGFSAECRQSLQDSTPGPDLEEVFLEEGLSHLAENLAGYGVSGGNIAFVARYLERTADTPLDSVASPEFGDSVERRGGMVLLLSWQYEKRLEKGEGITFLQAIYDSRKRGWARLEEATGLKKEEILDQFAIFLSHRQGISPRFHPDTGEPIAIDPWCGPVDTLGYQFDLEGPTHSDLSETCGIAPCSLLFGTSFSSEQCIAIQAEQTGGSGILRLILNRD